MTIERMREGGRVSGRDGTLEKRFFAVSSLRRDVSKYCTEHRDHMTTNKRGFGAPVPTGGVPAASGHCEASGFTFFLMSQSHL